MVLVKSGISSAYLNCSSLHPDRGNSVFGFSGYKNIHVVGSPVVVPESCVFFLRLWRGALVLVDDLAFLLVMSSRAVGGLCVKEVHIGSKISPEILQRTNAGENQRFARRISPGSCWTMTE